jgi:hypothetical protein
VTDPALLRDAAALLIVFGASGWLLGLILMPGGLGGAERLWLSLALSVPATVLAAAPALALQALAAWSFLPGLAALALLAGGVHRRALRTLPDLPARLLCRVRVLPVARVALAGVAALVGWYAVLAPHLAGRRGDRLPLSMWVWYYWLLVREVVAEGGIPRAVQEWGAPRPFPTEYLFHTLHASAASALSGDAGPVFLERYRIAVVVLGLLAAYTLWRRWLPVWWAWVAAVLTLSATRLSIKFAAFWPETLGMVLLFWSGWLLDEALERRSPRWGAVAGLVSASAFLTHAEIWLLTGPLWLGILLGRLLPWAWRRATGDVPDGRTSIPRRSVLAASGPLWTAAAAFVVLLLGASLLTGSTGRLGEIAKLGGEEPGTEALDWRSGPDPTWALHSALYDPNLVRGPAPSIERCAQGLGMVFRVDVAYAAFAGVDARAVSSQILIVLAAAVVLAALPGLPPSARRGAITWLVFLAGVQAGSMAFCGAYETYVPERAGYQRILPNYVVAVAGLFAVAGWVLSRGFFRALAGSALGRVRSGVPVRLRAALAALPMSALLLVGLTPMNREPVRDDSAPVSTVSYEAYRWIAENAPADATVLVNGFTAGTVAAASGRTGWLDGRAPYIESPEWRAEATRTALEARAFFEDPFDAPPLPPEIDYVIAARPDVNLGGSVFPTDLEALQQLPWLRRVARFGDGRVVIYEVARDEDAASARPGARASVRTAGEAGSAAHPGMAPRISLQPSRAPPRSVARS